MLQVNRLLHVLVIVGLLGLAVLPTPVYATAIDVGGGATDRSSAYASGWTRIDKNNPANATGQLTSFEVWFTTNGSGVKMGTAYYTGTGTVYCCRDYETLGSVTSGSKQTFSGLGCDVTSGDYIAVYFSGGTLEFDTSGAGIVGVTKDAFDLGNTSFIYSYADRTISLYGTGTTPTPSLTNAPDSKALGVVAASTTYYAYGSAPSNPVSDGECTFTITNDGSIAIDVAMKASNFTGGVGWTLGTPAENVARITSYYSGQDPASGLVLTTSDQSFYSNLAASGTKKWDFKFESPTSFTDGVAKSSTLTLTATAH